jgi:signal transduction histidine kinase/DNA-binding response OmpR family regulator
VAVKGYIAASVRRVTNAFRLRGPLAADPTAQMLHALLVMIAVWMAVGLIVTLNLAPITLARLVLPLVLEVSLAAALILVRLGQFRRASLVYLAGSWVWATAVVYISGGIRTHALILYGALPISAAWLLGYGAALWTAGICSVTTLIFVCLEMFGSAPPRILLGTPLGAWFLAVQAMLIGTIPVGQVIKKLLETLTELQKYQQDLESLVDQRTAELVKSRDEAEAANRAKSVFLANMSHELRTPLNAILGFSGLVMQDTGLPERHRKDLAIVGKSGEHLLELIDEILDMVKIETGRTAVERVSIDLHGLVTDTVNLLRERAQTKNLELLVDISSRAPELVYSDPRKLRQVLINLVENALKYTDKGKVVVALDAHPGDDSSDVTLIFDVEDTGIGIAPEDQVRIFDPFVQAGGARTGTGLGLSICRRFVELMDGSIQVESAPGRGSRFHVELRTQISSGVIVETSSVARVIGVEKGQPDYRILIVEDERENWLLLQRLLETVGFQTRVAENGAQAVETFELWRPHFIWMDVRIPVLSGLEAARRIREIEGGREVKIVALTASAFQSQREEVLAAGFDDFLRKPYRSEEVFDCMARHLGVRYVYETRSEPAAQDLTHLLRPESLAQLPPAKLEELERAVISLDPSRIGLVVAQVSEKNASVGAALRRLTDKLAYSPILHAIQSYKRFAETKAGMMSVRTANGDASDNHEADH